MPTNSTEHRSSVSDSAGLHTKVRAGEVLCRVPKIGWHRWMGSEVKWEDHLVNRPGAIQTDGLKHKQPNRHLGTQNGFVEGRFPSVKCQNGCLCQASKPEGKDMCK